MRTLCLLYCLLISMACFGQADRDLLIGGSINLNYRTTDAVELQTSFVTSPVFPFEPIEVRELVPIEERSFSVNFFPYVGKVLSPRVIAGLGLDLRFTTNTVDRDGNPSSFTNNSHTLGGYLWLRYTLNPKNRVRLYLEPRLGYAHSEGIAVLFVRSNVFSSGPTNTFFLNTPLGVTYSLNERFLLNVRTGSFNITRRSWENFSGGQEGNSLDVGLSLSARTFSFGVDYLF